jgi:hypothetical protein
MHATNYLPNSKKLSSGRNLQKWNEDITKVNLFNQYEGEILTNYGGRFDKAGKEYNMQYFTSKELQDSVTDVNKVNYNNFLPHYQLGYALYHEDYQSLADYLDPTTGKSLERSHNTMHNNMHFIMMDDNYSLTNLVFFLYHSWIDAQLEMKIRMVDDYQGGQDMLRKLSEISQREQYFDPLLNPNQEQRLFGEYPIIEWSDPKFVNLVNPHENVSFQEKIKRCEAAGLTADSVKVAFPSFWFIMREDGFLRKTFDLQAFYNQTNYYNNHKEYFAEYKGFIKYNASYDYEIFETTYDGTTFKNEKNLLGDFPSPNIPKYLQAMQREVNGFREYVKQFVSTYKGEPKLTRTLRYYSRLAVKGLMLLINYSSSLPNGNYLLKANLSKLSEELQKRKVGTVKEQ